MTVAGIDLLSEDLYSEGRLHDALRTLRENDPVCWHPEHDGGPGFWALTRYADVVHVARDPITFSSEEGVQIPSQPMGIGDFRGTMMIMTDPPHHTKLRKLVSKGFTPRAMARLSDFMREITGRVLDDVEPGVTYDFIHDIAAPLPLTVICELIGIPLTDRDGVRGFMDVFLSFGPETDEAARMSATTQLWSYFHELCASRRAEPKDDLVSVLIGAEVDGEQLTEFELDAFLFMLVAAGIETTRTSLTSSMYELSRRPDLWTQLRAEPAMLPAAIEELLRYISPVTSLRRTATVDTEVGGKPIRAGDKVVLWFAAANRDPEVFADPDTLDFTRSPNDHMAFGHGTHFCLGNSLARVEMRVMLEELLTRYRRPAQVAGTVEWKTSVALWGLRTLPVRFAA